MGDQSAGSSGSRDHCPPITAHLGVVGDHQGVGAAHGAVEVVGEVDDVVVGGEHACVDVLGSHQRSVGKNNYRKLSCLDFSYIYIGDLRLASRLSYSWSENNIGAFSPLRNLRCFVFRKFWSISSFLALSEKLRTSSLEAGRRYFLNIVVSCLRDTRLVWETCQQFELVFKGLL